MGEVEDFEELLRSTTINPKTGKPEGEAGRPSNLWREFQEFRAFRELGLSGLGTLDRGIQEEPEKDGFWTTSGLTDGLGDIAKNPIVAAMLSKVGGLTALLGGLWIAEDHIKIPTKQIKIEETQVDDLDKPIIDEEKYQSALDRYRDVDVNRNDFIVGYEQKMVTRQVSETVYTDFPPFLHTLYDILILILPLITQAVKFLGGSIEDIIEKAKSDYKTLTDDELNMQDAKVSLNIFSPVGSAVIGKLAGW